MDLFKECGEDTAITEVIMKTEHKSVNIELKGEKEGSFVARIATLNVKDKDDDVTLNGAFPEGKEVLISAYQHNSWGGALPVGKAVIQENGEEVIATGQFNLKTDMGKQHYETVKFTGGLQEWSYGFKVKEWEVGEHEGDEVRFLKSVDPLEISPVLVGAGNNTATLGIKGDKTTYADHAEAVLAAVDELVSRTKSLADLRAKDGRTLSKSHRDRMKGVQKSLAEMAMEVKELVDQAEPFDYDSTAALLLHKIEKNLED